MGRTGKHAVVIGASIAGLCAARVLSDFFDRVTLFERDELPDGPAQRSAVPQGRHLHLLMARGALEFDSHFPGLLDDMVAAGHILGTQHRLQDEFTAHVPSRPHLEWQIRRRMMAMDYVDFVRTAVTEPTFDATAQRVSGVLLDTGEKLPADLVVDATGRGTRLPVWLAQWGFDRPSEDIVDVGISYASHQLRIPEGLIAEKVVVCGASREQPRGLGMLCYEDGTWVLTTFGVAKVKPPDDFAGMCALADEILPAHLAAAIRRGEPIGDVAFHKYPTSRWRRYDKLERFPAGIIPFGDAVVRVADEYDRRYGLDSIHLRAIAQLNFTNARSSPNAQTRGWTVPDLRTGRNDDDEVNPVIEGRLRRFDCSQMTDGGAGVVLATDDYLRDHPDVRPIGRIDGWGHRTAGLGLQQKLDHAASQPFVLPHVRGAVLDAFDRGQLTLDDVDGFEVHDWRLRTVRSRSVARCRSTPAEGSSAAVIRSAPPACGWFSTLPNRSMATPVSIRSRARRRSAR
jgi:hypothetical protein